MPEVWGSVNWVQLREIRGGRRMSELHDLLFLEYGTARVLGVIGVGLYVTALILKKLLVRYWKDDDEETSTSQERE